MESVAPFLDELARQLVPACDPDVVQAVLARASAGYAGPRGRDGLRVTAITPSGVPFEASVTGGAGRLTSSLRYVTETATGMPFFGPRLAAQRAALDDLVGWLPSPARAAGDELREAIDLLFPDPARVPARRRFATAFGVVHRPEVPGGIAGLKLYGNLRAHDEGGGAGTHAGRETLRRLARRWPAFAALRDAVDDLPFLVPHFATVEVDAAGRLGHKLYLRTRSTNAAGLALATQRFGGDFPALAGELTAAGVAGEVWRRPLFVCGEVVAGEGPEGTDLAISLHLSAKVLRLGAGGMAALARRVVQRHGDPAGLAAMARASDRAGGPGAWTTTVVGVGLPPGGGVGKVNVYMAPTAAGEV